jgi:alpha-tubulin suppressor-like RCC1 family protein
VRLITVMGRATVGALGVALATLLLPSVGPAISPLLLPGAAAAAARSAPQTRVADAAPSAVKITAVAGGLYHSVAVSSTGAVFAWGWNVTGQLCNGNTKGSVVPVKVGLLAGKKVVAIAAGFAHTLAVTSTGAVFNCGKNDDGELGDGGTTDSDVPVKVDLAAGTKVTSVVAGAGHSLAVTSTGAVLAWGLNLYGGLGNGGTGSSDVPVNVGLPAGTKVTAVAVGSLHSLALTSTGAVFAWGYNTNGELGDGGTTTSDVPVKVDLPAGTKVTAIAAGGYDSLALTSTGAVFAWGYNTDGELGDGGTANSAVPVRAHLPAGVKVTAIAAGELQSLAVTSTGGVLAWGGNNFGQLGDGSYKGSDVPVKVDLPGTAPGLTATPGLTQPALAATAPVATRSTVFAGYNFANYIAVPGAVSAIIVVPKLNCKTSPPAGSAIDVGVGIQSVNSYARLYLACTPQRVALYYPSLVINGSTRNIASDVAHPGDTIEFAVSQSVSQVTISVIDMTHKFIATSNGTGGGTGEGIMAGDFPVVSGVTSAVPNFGTLDFSSALINGYPFGSAETGLQADDLSATTSGPVQVKTTYSASNKEVFATVFEHS